MSQRMAKDSRDLVAWEPFGMATPLREAVNRLFEDSFISPARLDPMLARGLPVDVFESEGEYIIEASLPGVKPEDLEVTATEETISIRAAIKHETRDTTKGTYIRRERQEGEVYRSVTLRTPIDPAKVSASFEHGVLRLTAPKSELAKPRHVTVTTH